MHGRVCANFSCRFNRLFPYQKMAENNDHHQSRLFLDHPGRFNLNYRFQNSFRLQTQLAKPVSIGSFTKFQRSRKVLPISNLCEMHPEINQPEDNIGRCTENVGNNIICQTLMSTTAHLLSLLGPNDYLNNVSNMATNLDKFNRVKISKSTFQLYGNNGIKIIRDILITNGWTEGKFDIPQTDAKLIWADNLMLINIWDFREGFQLLNHVPNVHLLSNKISLLRCLQDYNVFKKCGTGLRMSDFVPETYRLDLRSDRLLYCEQHKRGELWICKAATLNQGKGIFLVKSADELCARLKRLEAEESEKHHFSKPINARLIQKYISSPLLLNCRKADIRAYMHLASVRPFVVLFQEGYVRLSCNPYNIDSLDPQTHLTNQCMQRRNPLYDVMKEETVWSMDRLSDHVAYNHSQRFTSSKRNLIRTSLQNQMCRIMLHCFHAVKMKLDRRTGFFELLGFDFLVDTSLKVWLLEINTNSSLQVNCTILQKVIPTVLEEAIDISLECFEKSKRGVRILPLQSIRSSVLLYCEEMPYMKTIPKLTPSLRKKTLK